MEAQRQGPELNTFIFYGPDSTHRPHDNHFFPPAAALSILSQGQEPASHRKPTLAFFVLIPSFLCPTSSHSPIHCLLHKAPNCLQDSFLERSFQAPASSFISGLNLYFLLILLPCLEKNASTHIILTTCMLLVMALDGLFCLPSNLTPHPSPPYSLHPGRGRHTDCQRGATAPLASGPVGWQRQEEAKKEEFTLLAPTLQSLRWSTNGQAPVGNLTSHLLQALKNGFLLLRSRLGGSNKLLLLLA